MNGVVLSLIFAQVPIAPPAWNEENHVQWRTNYSEAMEEALKKKKPIFVKFFTERCLPCQKMDQEVFQNKEVIKTINSNFIPIKLKDGDISNKVGIRLFPAIVIASFEGTIERNDVGFVSADVLLSRIDGFLHPQKKTVVYVPPPSIVQYPYYCPPGG